MILPPYHLYGLGGLSLDRTHLHDLSQLAWAGVSKGEAPPWECGGHSIIIY